MRKIFCIMAATLAFFFLFISCDSKSTAKTDNQPVNDEVAGGDEVVTDDTVTDNTVPTDDTTPLNCGNGVTDTGEACDGDAKECAQINSAYIGGWATCKIDCSGYDVSGCTVDPDADIPAGDDTVDDDGLVETDDSTSPDDDAPLPACTGAPYTVVKGAHALYDGGCQYAITVGSDPVDLYIPAAPENDTLYTAIFMQGAKVDKGFYSNFAKLLTSYGFVVAIPNHDSFSGTNMTENKAFNAVWDFIKAATADNTSPLFQRTSIAKVAVMGHSNGGMAAVGIIGNTCGQPTCSGTYQAPVELAAGILYGTNTVMPIIGTVSAFNTRNIPTIFLQGRIDSKAKYDDTIKTLDKTTGTPVVFVALDGMNHYGICDMNNPAGAAADNNAPTTDQATGIETNARWAAMFLRAHLFDDADAHTYVYDGTGDTADAIAAVEQIK